MLLNLSHTEIIFELLLPLDAKSLHFGILFLDDNILSLLEDITNLLISELSNVKVKGIALGTIEIPVTVSIHEFLELGWV